MADVSIDYLIRLEQGRDTNPSPEVLVALGHALRLDDEELRHLLALGAVSASPQLEHVCRPAPAVDAQVPATVRTLLERLDPTPAFVVGPLRDVLASNDAWRSVAAPLGIVESGNLARYVFVHPAASAALPRWPAVADAEVARLRSAQRQLETDPAFVALIDELSAAPSFAERWAVHDPSRGETDTADVADATVVVHPEVGTMRWDEEVLALAHHDHLLVTWLPSDEATSAALRTLTAHHPVSPAQLRVVGDA